MSETTIKGFSISPDFVASLASGKYRNFYEKILDKQSDLLEECNLRFENGDFEDYKPIDAKDALKFVLSGEVRKPHLYECFCAVEPILIELGQSLEDTTEQMSLNNNLDFWLDDFANIFEELGLKKIKDLWQRSNFPILPKDESVTWPAITLFTSAELANCFEEFSNIDFESALNELDEDLFTKKSDDMEAEELIETMQQNIECIFSWVKSSLDSGNNLVIIFDGDS